MHGSTGSSATAGASLGELVAARALGVDVDADVITIQRAFRGVAKDLHPDRGSDQGRADIGRLIDARDRLLRRAAARAGEGPRSGATSLARRVDQALEPTTSPTVERWRATERSRERTQRFRDLSEQLMREQAAERRAEQERRDEIRARAAAARCERVTAAEPVRSLASGPAPELTRRERKIVARINRQLQERQRVIELEREQRAALRAAAAERAERRAAARAQLDADRAQRDAGADRPDPTSLVTYEMIDLTDRSGALRQPDRNLGRILDVSG